MSSVAPSPERDPFREIKQPEFGQRLRLLRERRGLVLESLRNYSGVRRSTLTNLERGSIRYVRASTLKKLAAVLEVEGDDPTGNVA